jgi:hypothetical protein
MNKYIFILNYNNNNNNNKRKTLKSHVRTIKNRYENTTCFKLLRINFCWNRLKLT